MLLTSENYRAFLSEELVRRIRSNANYSQRSFARQLGLSPGELSEVLRGKRPLSLKSALRIAQGLGFSAEETKRLVMMVQREKSREFDDASLAPLLDEANSSARTKQLSLDVFTVISEWYHFAILSLAECEHFKWEPKWIAARLGIQATQARVALDRLQRVGLVSKTNGKFQATGENLATPDGIPSEAIRNYHKSILEKAAEALENQPVAQREISGISVAISRRALPDFKKDVSRFLDEMGVKYGTSSRKQEVYQLEMALFRLTRGEQQ